MDTTTTTIQDIAFDTHQGPYPDDGDPLPIDLLVDLLADQETQYRDLKRAVHEARDLTDLAARMRKMFAIFGSALRAEIQGRMIDDMEGVHFWQMHLQEMAEDVDRRAKTLHAELKEAKERRPRDDKLLKDVVTYLLNRSTQDEEAGDLAGRLMKMLGIGRGPDHE